MFDLEFWKNFLSNALATFAGVIIGIPVALWINRIQQTNSNNMEKERAKTEAKTRKRKILELLLNELNQNNNLLKSFIPKEYTDSNLSISEDLREFYDISGIGIKHAFLLRIELWRALSDGGELQWIQDTDLLFSISTAYEAIKTVRGIGDEYNRYQRELTLNYGWPKEQPQAGAIDAEVLGQDLHLLIRRTIQLVDRSIFTLKKDLEFKN